MAGSLEVEDSTVTFGGVAGGKEASKTAANRSLSEHLRGNEAWTARRTCRGRGGRG